MRRKHIEWLVIIICVLLFVITTIFVNLNKTVFFDTNIHNFINNLPFNDMFWKSITFLASPTFIIIALIFLIIFIKNKVFSFLIFINTINVFLLNQGLKLIFSRPRPEFKLIEEAGFSFPSGHAMISLSFYGFLIFIIWHMNLKHKNLLTILLVILIILVGFSRVYLGVHYPSDVLAGFVLSLAYLLIFIKIVKRYQN